MTAYCILGEELKRERDILPELGSEGFDDFDAHLKECECCRQADTLEAWAAEYDNAEHDFVQDNLEY